MATKTKPASETLADVKRALTTALGKPKRKGRMLRFPAPESRKDRTSWIARVHAAGGAATISPTNGPLELCLVGGRPSALMSLTYFVHWNSPSAIKAFDALDDDAGLRFMHIDYTKFKLKLDRVPEKAAEHAKRLAKLDSSDAGAIEKSLLKRKWSR